jgi:maltose/maltodextrin transport system permease protein
VFPLLYTVTLSFTNIGSSNLLDFERARQHLEQERIEIVGAEPPYQLLLTNDGQYLIRLLATRDNVDLTTQSFHLGAINLPILGLSPHISTVTGKAQTKQDIVLKLADLRRLQLEMPDDRRYALSKLEEFSEAKLLYIFKGKDEVQDTVTTRSYSANHTSGFYTHVDGEQLLPGFRVLVELSHYKKMFNEARFRLPFLSVLMWTVVFAAISVVAAGALGMLLAVFLEWPDLEGRAFYRHVLFLPYAIPGFISILVERQRHYTQLLQLKHEYSAFCNGIGASGFEIQKADNPKVLCFVRSSKNNWLHVQVNLSYAVQKFMLGNSPAVLQPFAWNLTVSAL